MKTLKNLIEAGKKTFFIGMLIFALPSSYAQNVNGYDSEFVKYTFVSGPVMNYDQKSLVTITMKNTGQREWNGTWNNNMEFYQDDNDINWRPQFFSPLFIGTVYPGQTVDISFFVTPKNSCFLVINCYATTFKFQLAAWHLPMLPNARERFGAFTPNPGLVLRNQQQLPTNPPVGYTGMQLVRPPGSAPITTPAITFPNSL
jgi:hypothetical protein